MTTTLQIRVDDKLKKEFLKKSRDIGLDGSMLIRYFMTSFTEKQDIVKFKIKNDFYKDLIKDKKIINKLEKISNKLDEIGF